MVGYQRGLLGNISDADGNRNPAFLRTDYSSPQEGRDYPAFYGR